MFKNARSKGWKPPVVKWSTGSHGRPGLPKCIVCGERLERINQSRSRFICRPCDLKYPLSKKAYAHVLALHGGKSLGQGTDKK
jgi:hypothetical protein